MRTFFEACAGGAVGAFVGGILAEVFTTSVRVAFNRRVISALIKKHGGPPT